MLVLSASQQAEGASPAGNQRPSPSALSPPPSQGFSPYSLLLTKLVWLVLT
jgi:hypothetical protein